MRDWVKIERVGLAAQAECFERDGSAAGEHVQNLRARGASLLYILDGDFLPCLGRQSLGMSFEDMVLRLFNDGGIARILAQPLDELGGIGPAQALLLIIRPVCRDKSRRGHKRPIHRRPARHQRPARPPEVKG